MSAGTVHSEDCKVGTSHNVPQDCKGADFKAIQYPVVVEEAEIGHSDPQTNSEEGLKALEALTAAIAAVQSAPAPQAEPVQVEAKPEPQAAAEPGQADPGGKTPIDLATSTPVAEKPTE